MHSSGEDNIKEDDEVILELDMSSNNNSIAKPKRNISHRSTLPCIVLLCAFMLCGFFSLAIAFYAQILVIPDAGSAWTAMALSSGLTQNPKPFSLVQCLLP